MIIGGGVLKTLKLVNCKHSHKMYLANSSGQRITPKFILKKKNRCGTFMHINTDIGNYVWNTAIDSLVYQDNNPTREITLSELGEHLYEISYEDKEWLTYRSELYTQYGMLLTKEFTRTRELKNGLIATEKDGKWGFIDDDANVIIPFEYAGVQSFDKFGLAVVDTEQKGGYLSIVNKTVIDKKGNKLFEPIMCAEMGVLSEDRIKIWTRKGKGIIDSRGKTIVPDIYRELCQKDDFYMVSYNNKWGLLDIDGNIVFETIYDEIIETPEKFVVKDFAKQEVQKTKEVSRRKEE